MAKKISFELEKVLHGINMTADVTKSTLGPKGRNIAIDDPSEPQVINDGVRIANSISFEDAEENFGAYLVKNCSSQTNDNAGDGTTTTAVLLQAVIHEAMKRPENPMDIRSSLLESSKEVVKKIKILSRPIKTDEQIQQIATISAENETHGKMIAEIIKKVGKDGVITVEDSRGFITDYDIVEGYEAGVGFMSPHFITDQKGAKAVYEKVAIAVFEHKIDTLGDIKSLFDMLQEQGINNIVLVCFDIDNSVLGNLVLTKLQGRMGITVIRAAHSDLLDDIAAATGASVVAERTGIPYNNVIPSHLGMADKVISSEKKTLFYSKKSHASKQAKRLEELALNTQNPYEKKKYAERAAKLRGQIAVIRVGAPTDMEKWYVKHKLEDAVNATQSAIEEGVVEGGGMALYRIAQGMNPKTIGDEILKRALTAPLRTILDNAGKDYATVLMKMPTGKGYNARTDTYQDLRKEGIIDPSKVTRCAVENAVSTGAQFITTNAIITSIPEPKV